MKRLPYIATALFILALLPIYSQAAGITARVPADTSPALPLFMSRSETPITPGCTTTTIADIAYWPVDTSVRTYTIRFLASGEGQVTFLAGGNAGVAHIPQDGGPNGVYSLSLPWEGNGGPVYLRSDVGSGYSDCESNGARVLDFQIDVSQ